MLYSEPFFHSMTQVASALSAGLATVGELSLWSFTDNDQLGQLFGDSIQWRRFFLQFRSEDT